MSSVDFENVNNPKNVSNHIMLESMKPYKFVQEFWVYYICTAKFLTFLDGGGILDLFYVYCKIPDIFGRRRNFGSILFVLQNLNEY